MQNNGSRAITHEEFETLLDEADQRIDAGEAKQIVFAHLSPAVATSRPFRNRLARAIAGRAVWMEPYRLSTVLRAVVFGLGLLTASAVMLCGWIEPAGLASTGLLLLGAALYTPQVRQVLHGYGVADGADIAAQRRLNLILLVGLLPLVPYAPALLLLMLACGVGSILASRLLRCAYAPVAGLSLVWPQRNVDVVLGTALSPSCAYVVEPHGYTALVQAEEAAEKAKETAARAAAGDAPAATVYPPQAAHQAAPQAANQPAPERGGAAA